MNRNSMLKRLLSLVLSLVLVASCLPAGVLPTASAAAGAAGVIVADTKVDPSTFNSWRDTSFNPSNLTTEHAGGVWTDKTVVKAGDADDVFVDKDGNPLGITAGANNFLVALSALGANSVVAGQSSTPTDVIFVLDVSNSMENTDLSSMVTAANDAIHSLLTSNDKNRVGVAVYSTNVNILLPLDRYTPVEKGYGNNRTNAYIEMSTNYGEIRTARTGYGYNATYVQNSNGDDVTTSINASGATYIQGGLWQAYQMFNNATVSDVRTPVLVLMSDGAPSYGTEDYNSVSTTSRDVGNGGTGSITDGLAFLTQLTAAYVKEKIADKYNTEAYFYSVGLGVSEDGQSVSIAESVLDTSKTRTDPEGWWSTYLGLANQTTKTMRFNAAGEDVTVTYDPTITSASKTYTNRYFPASDASQLGAAFKGIVNEINLKAGYTVTRIEDTDAHTDGYVTFVDEIGTGMQVKDIKGILVGDMLYTGQRLAQALLNREFGTADEPTDLGDNMVWALRQRLGVTDKVLNTADGPVTVTAKEQIHDLIQQAYDAGQIAYNSTTGAYSNLICWFSDANGDYLGFWDAADPNAVIPAGAAYANASYGMLGTTTDSQTAHASDMMYVAVMVSKKVTEVNGQPAVEAKTPELVTFRVPASLLPTVTYQIDVKAASGEEINESTPATITYNAAEPIRLVYEVGVHNQLTPENIKDFLREGYLAKDPVTGNYYLYTNAWYWEPSTGVADPNNPPTKENDIGKEVLFDTSKNHISYAYFEPGLENEHYYYTEDTDLYTYNGTTYEKLTTAPVTGGSVKYYFQHKVFESKQAAAQTGVPVDAQVSIHYGEVSQKLIENSNNYAVDSDGVYYIKEGTMHYHTIHDHDKSKTTNETQSFGYRLHQLVDIAVTGKDASHHFEIMYLGNNGRITYSPAQGFTLSKAMAAGAIGTGDFIFDVTVSADADGKYTETVNGVSTEKTMTNNGFRVSLEAGGQVTVTGLDVGETYEITERQRDGYKLGGIVVSSGSVSGATATGTVAENQIHSVTYTNDIQHYGSLLVTKQVTYQDKVNPATDNNEFNVIVTLKDGTEPFVGKVLVNANDERQITDGIVKFKIKKGEQVILSGIPVGVTYAVAEDKTNMPAGYTWTNEGNAALSGTINEAGRVAQLLNEYDPDDVVIGSTDPAITLQVNKEVVVTLENPATLMGAFDFKFLLQRYDTAVGDWVTVSDDTTIQISNPSDPRDSLYGNGDDNRGSKAVSLSGIPFSSAGEHYFRVAEDISNIPPAWTYDRTHHDFKVIITDTDLDGKLEIASVEKVDDTVTVTPSDTNSDNVADTWAVGASFTNRYQSKSTKLTIAAKKTLTGTTLKDGQFAFALYNVNDDTYNTAGVTPIIAKNGANGEIVFTTETYPYVSGIKKYYYVMKELSTDGDGVTTDKSVWQIEVQVTGDASGNAVVDWTRWKRDTSSSWDITSGGSVFDKITFTNTYEAAPATLELSGRKTLTNMTPGVAEANRDMTASIEKNDYYFELTEVNGGYMDVIDANNVVTAVLNRLPGVQAGGAIDLLQGSKLYYVSAGTYKYKVTEPFCFADGVTKDNTIYTVVVEVEDNGLGQLVATPTYWIGDVQANEIVFNNTYTAAPVTDLKIHADKVLNVDPAFDRPMMANEFRATLTYPDGTTETVFNDASGKFSFASLSFDAVGTYNYSISEVVPHGAVNNKLNGVIYDAAAKDFTIVVEDDGNGQLVAKLNGTQTLSSTSTLAATITNTYTADPAHIHLLAHKDLDGRDLGANEFSFKIEAITPNAPMPAAPVVRNSAEGDVDFGTITYGAIGVYEYKVTEQKLDENGDPIVPVGGEYIYKGVTYSIKEYTVTVTVTDLRHGKMVAHVVSKDQNNLEQPGGIVFTNSYHAEPVTVNVEGDSANTGGKTFTDESSLSANKKDLDDFVFKFRLVTLDGTVIETAEDNGAGFSFADIEYTQTGEYQYLIYEVPTGKPGVVYDYAKYKVTVTVTDDGVGALQADVKYEKAESGESDVYQTVNGVLFENSYKAKETSVSFAGKKTLTGGRVLKADDFSFVLKNASGDEIETVKNKADGTFGFETITYNAEGTYTYTLEEKKGDVEGITYDAAKYAITVTVEDVNGELKATTVITKDGKAADNYGFTNIYTPKAVSTAIEVQKELVNKSEEAVGLNGFVFQLENGTEKKTLTTGADGKVKFDLTFAAADVGETYTYKLTEVKGDKAHMTYDATAYEIKVTVKQAPTGELELVVQRTGTGAFKFVNTYAPPVPTPDPEPTDPAPTEPAEPTKPNDDPPKTGDESNIGAWTLMMAVSAICGLAVLVLGKKKLFEQ